MGEKKSNLYSNGTKNLVTNKNYTAPMRLWEKLEINEWTFTFSLLIISLSIVLGKLYINYGSILQLQNNDIQITPLVSVFSNISNIFDLLHIPNVSRFSVIELGATSEKFVNVSQYDHVVSVTTSFFKSYGWLIKAAICGLFVMGFTWFIIYKDSSIPGINPPSPLSPFKQRFPRDSGIQMNYLIGILNGILIFVYMCF